MGRLRLTANTKAGVDALTRRRGPALETGLREESGPGFFARLFAKIRWKAKINLLALFIIQRQVLVLIAVILLIDGSQFQRVAGDDFEIDSALIALNDLSFLDVIDIDVQGVVTFRAYD
jgi:hypothetical protein